MSTKSKRHAHKYHRVNTKMGKIWTCALPDCNHHMPQHYEEMLPGRNSICWGCGEVFQLDLTNMKSDKPQCISCLAPGLIDILQQDEIKLPESSPKSESNPISELEKVCSSCGMYKPVPGNPDGICYRCWLKTQ